MSKKMLIENGRPNFRIVIPSQPSAVEEYAAEELELHLNRIAGRRPSSHSSGRDSMRSAALIFLNSPEDAAGPDGYPLPEEGFRIRSDEDRLFISGGGPRGLLYGVYDFLESLGCRWYTPDVSFVPTLTNLPLPSISKTESPCFEFRDIFNWEARDARWWTRNRLNGMYTPVPAEMGGQMKYGLFVHTFHTLLPPEEFFREHPEYFALVRGQRRRDNAQLCLTNPAVADIVAQRLAAVIREKPDCSIFSVSQNDCEGYCECPDCAAVAAEEGSQSGPIIRFVNRIAEKIEKDFPDKLVDTLAYWYSLDAPRLAVPRRNVRVRLCSIRCCQGHGYGACSHPESARFLKALEQWSAITHRIYIWHYATNFANYPLPMPDYDELNANLRLYRKFGVYGVFVQGMGEEGGGAETMALRAWILSRLLWKADQPVWPLIDEFLRAVYGGGAAGVRKYLDIFHDHVRANPDCHPSLYDSPEHPLFDPALIRPAELALASAEAAARGPAKDRVRLLRAGLRYARLCRAGRRFRVTGKTFSSGASPRDRSELESVIRLWKRLGVKRIREGEPLEASVTRLRARLGSHPLLRLETESAALAIAPTLGGRILEWRTAHRQWLAYPDPANKHMPYPLSEGCVEFVQTGMYSFCGWFESYAARRSGKAVILTCRPAKGLVLARAVALEGSAVLISSLLTNISSEAISVGWGAGVHFDIPEKCALAWTDRRGSERKLECAAIEAGWEKAAVFEAEDLPAASWRLEGGDWTIVHVFECAKISRAIAGRSPGGGILGLDIRTAVEPLGPGESIAARQELRIRAPGI